MAASGLANATIATTYPPTCGMRTAVSLLPRSGCPVSDDLHEYDQPDRVSAVPTVDEHGLMKEGFYRQRDIIERSMYEPACTTPAPTSRPATRPVSEHLLPQGAQP